MFRQLPSLCGGIVDAIFGGNDTPSAPDPNPGMIASAQSSERVGMRMADIAEKAQTAGEARNVRLDALGERFLNQQMGIAEENQALSRDYAARMKGQYYPLEDQILVESIGGGNLTEEQAQQLEGALGTSDRSRAVGQAIRTAQRQAEEEAATTAGSQVQGAIGRQREDMTRYLAGLGMAPNPEQFIALNNELNARGAALSADASNKAREGVRTQGWAKRMDTAALGRGLPGSQATSAGIALQGTNSAATTAANTNAGAIQNQNSALPWFSGATSGFGTAGNIYGSEFNARMGGYQAALKQQSESDAGMFGALGNIAGAAISTWSDRRLKEDIVYVGTENGFDLYEFNYINDASGDRYIGVMADEVEKVRPDAVVMRGGYKAVIYSKIGVEFRRA